MLSANSSKSVCLCFPSLFASFVVFICTGSVCECGFVSPVCVSVFLALRVYLTTVLLFSFSCLSFCFNVTVFLSRLSSFLFNILFINIIISSTFVSMELHGRGSVWIYIYIIKHLFN